MSISTVYLIDSEYRQVMLSARELSIEKLPDEAQTWVNRRLVYTHGYGVTLAPVNEIDAQGLPVLMVQDIPPAGKIEISQPGIYFGENKTYRLCHRQHQTPRKFVFTPPAMKNVLYHTWHGFTGGSLSSTVSSAG
jgi:uncharacterized membrane protein (UPF0182 family)